MKKSESFIEDWHSLLEKYRIPRENVFLHNFDNDQLSDMQLLKVSQTDDGNFLVMAYSEKGENLCSCSEEAHEKE